MGERNLPVVKGTQAQIVLSNFKLIVYCAMMGARLGILKDGKVIDDLPPPETHEQRAARIRGIVEKEERQ